MRDFDQTPLRDIDSLDLVNELRWRLREPQTLGVRIRVALLATELDRRAHGDAA